MFKTGRLFIPGLLVSSLLAGYALAEAPTPPTVKKTATKNKAAKKVVLPPMPQGPLPQVPLSQLPSAPPQVDCRNGQLTIVAQNSTLSDILHGVQKCTGASIDVPGNANERVVTKLGPAPAREVLASLLNGSSFNYVMVGSAGSPTSLSSVILTPKPAGGVTPPSGGFQQSAVYLPPERSEAPAMPPPGGVRPGVYPQPIPNARVQNPPAADENAAEDDSADENANEENADDSAESQDTNGGAPANPSPGAPNAGPKTPEQILQMLQRAQQGQGPPEQSQQPPQQ
jgi:hypothetical protein